MTDIAGLQGDEVVRTQLTVDAQVEQRELAHTVLHLVADPERPDVIELEWSLLPDDLAFVPWLTTSVGARDAHDGLPSS
jgi:hypothetical protein